MHGLASDAYTKSQIDGLFATVETVDRRLIARGTYFVAEVDGALAGSGGWTDLAPPYEAGLDQASRAVSTATIRAVFVDPAFARRGIARQLVELAETDAALRGRAEVIDLVATLPGVPLYRRLGYAEGARVALPLVTGDVFPGVRMTKSLTGDDLGLRRAALHAA